MVTALARRRFTIEEFHRMGTAGILQKDDRVELLDGEIIEMTPIGSTHAAIVTRLSSVWSWQLPRQVIVRVQNPLPLEKTSEPQPDLALLPPVEDFYERTPIEPRRVQLVIEVADTSLDHDRAKLSVYAETGVREGWIVNIPDRAVEIYRDPVAGARYAATVRIMSRDGSFAALAFPEVRLTLADVFGR